MKTMISVSVVMAMAVSAQATWTITPGPALPGSGSGTLRDAYASAPNDAWSVGTQGGSGKAIRSLLVEHWNGTAWQLATVPSVSEFTTELYAVSGTSSRDIWAVGYQETSDVRPYPPEVSLVLHWDGTAWNRSASPNPVAFINRLMAVKAFAANDAWASGLAQSADGQPFTYFTLHWNGTSWTQITGPDPTMQIVGGSSSTDVWFMGATPVHWDGHSFTQVPGPVSSKIAAITASDAWGISASNGAQTLTHWNGNAWSTFTTLPASDNLSAVVALSSTDVWAVGNRTIDSNGNRATLTMQWNGTNWNVVPSPNPGSTFPFLLGAAAASPATVFAVGTGNGSLGNATLLMLTNGG